ncbi:MAG: S8 family serine peptidase [Oscillospiraceae bacterium]|nr:S8 family serine peptidase [Oscillospiraceae bacterium]
MIKKFKKFIIFFLLLILIPGVSSANTGNTGNIEDGGFVAGEVIALAESPEHAQQIALFYGLELKSYAYGVAVMYAPEPELAVNQSRNTRSAEAPVLSLNRIYTSFYTSLNALQWHHAEMESESAWEYSKGAGVLVAVIDSGIDVSHPAFAGRLSPDSYNSFTENTGLSHVSDDDPGGHGTHVAGIIAAAPTEFSAVSGVAPEAQLLIIKANNPASPKDYTAASVFRAINYAAEMGADVINMSFGRDFTGGVDPAEQTVITNALNSGAVMFGAAGNSRQSNAAYPAAYDEVIAVSATKQGYLFDSAYSHYGPQIDLAAPGTLIYSTARNGGYTTLSGTSMASPNAAGAAALVKSRSPGYTPQQIREILTGTAYDAGEPGWDVNYGYGIVNALGAVRGYTLIYGDLNGNGQVGTADVIILARHIAEFELLTGIFLEAADINRDGKVNIADLIMLARYVME